MNLYNSSTLTELSHLIGTSKNCPNYIHLIVDHDGEVLVECTSEKIRKLLPEYKFHVNGLNGKTHLGFAAANNLKYLNQLYKNIIFCWEKNISGAVDYDKITFIQNHNYWLEVNGFSQQAEIRDIFLNVINHESGLKTRVNI